MNRAAKHKRMQRAACRSLPRNKNAMWKRLCNTTEHKHGYNGQVDLDASLYYAPYMPIVSSWVA